MLGLLRAVWRRTRRTNSGLTTTDDSAHLEARRRLEATELEAWHDQLLKMLRDERDWAVAMYGSPTEEGQG